MVRSGRCSERTFLGIWFGGVVVGVAFRSLPLPTDHGTRQANCLFPLPLLERRPGREETTAIVRLDDPDNWCLSRIIDSAKKTTNP